MNKNERGPARLMRRGSFVVAAVLAACAVVASPSGATPTTTVTSASCSLTDSTLTFTWSGKTPFSFLVNVIVFLGEYIDTALVDKPNKDDTVTYDFGADFTKDGYRPLYPIKVWLFGKPHGNTPPSFGENTAALLDRFEVTCT